jgi:tetratricopeptide (TPR) repeat protein
MRSYAFPGQWLRPLAVVFLLAPIAPPAYAGISKTSGKVYMQQKVYDKAAFFLEKARLEDPKDVEVYALLSFARAQLRQYRSAGASFQIGIQLNEKGQEGPGEPTGTGLRSGLFNAGIAALNRAGNISAEDERSTGDSTTPRRSRRSGPPRDYAS